jgi:hypothetical protein
VPPTSGGDSLGLGNLDPQGHNDISSQLTEGLDTVVAVDEHVTDDEDGRALVLSGERRDEPRHACRVEHAESRVLENEVRKLDVHRLRLWGAHPRVRRLSRRPMD